MKKLSGLFINCIEAQDSIFESGKMVFQCLQNSEIYSLDYVEITPNKLQIPTNYDFYLFNYHVITMSWLETKSIKSLLPGIKMTMVLEVSPNDPFVFCSPDDFDVYIVLDPSLKTNKENVFAFPRPLEEIEEQFAYQPKEIPVIGSFGFATQGKGFEKVVEAVNQEFEKAIVRINIPYSKYADESREFAKQLAQLCKKTAKDGIEVIVTHDFMSKPKLIKWCAENTLNCFLYDRNMPGLAATTDQAISSGRPLIISKNDTFRHIEKFIKPYPEQTLKEAIQNTQEIVKEIQIEWSSRNFRKQFEETLNKLKFAGATKSNNLTDSIALKVTKSYKPTFIQNLRNTLAIKTRLRKLIKGKG